MNDSTTSEIPLQFRDRDIFEDLQGRLFVTLGYIQPIDRVLSYLKYIPDKNGEWIARDTKYRRIFWGSVDSAISGISLLPQSYTIEDTHFQTSLIEPPRNVIKKYYNPQQRMLEILEDPQDELEEITKLAAETLHDELEIPTAALGVAGSILWKGHNIAHSDINMNIYGYKNSWFLQKKYEQLDDRSHQIRLRVQTEWRYAIERMHQRIPILSEENLESLFLLRRALCVGDRCIGITPILLPEESPIEHGSESYTSISSEPITLKTTIESDTYGIFHPALYDIRPAEFDGETIHRIMVYDGAFGGLFRIGDKVDVSGMLQKVEQKSGAHPFNQIMVGTKAGSGKEYVLLSE